MLWFKAVKEIYLNQLIASLFFLFDSDSFIMQTKEEMSKAITA
ncbi:hypothetical protein QY97_03181 [Bacillus thermotolerans]|uniref:Uncharacterized protein n=1 Tax=Bacillus thermotolerans TaxID=1221996 RepID=A0A0F5HJT6_BACTR|nr:hypothetical protein QY97_03181 [Bacillus thermotolerans]KKB35160.1 hypothetical protein QY95_03564 [Bacillus thermotolerans]KKB38139.1 hypothetical protein QY96_03101 [Bacillus thermotolerans]